MTRTRAYNDKRETKNIKVPYFVNENFKKFSSNQAKLRQVFKNN